MSFMFYTLHIIGLISGHFGLDRFVYVNDRFEIKYVLLFNQVVFTNFEYDFLNYDLNFLILVNIIAISKLECIKL